MFRYNKAKIFIMIFFDIMFLIAAIGLSIIEKSAEPFAFAIPSVILTIFIFAFIKINVVLTKYETAMSVKDYTKAEKILTKHMPRYKWLAVLKVNLYLVEGKIELYLFHYNNFTGDLNGKRLRNYKYLLQAYKIYFDFLSGAQMSFAETDDIPYIAYDNIYRMFVDNIKQYSAANFESVFHSARQNVFKSGNGLMRYLNIYLIYLCAKKLNLDERQYISVLKEYAYNDYLQQHCAALTIEK